MSSFQCLSVCKHTENEPYILVWKMSFNPNNSVESPSKCFIYIDWWLLCMNNLLPTKFWTLQKLSCYFLLLRNWKKKLVTRGFLYRKCTYTVFVFHLQQRLQPTGLFSCKHNHKAGPNETLWLVRLHGYRCNIMDVSQGVSTGFRSELKQAWFSGPTVKR